MDARSITPPDAADLCVDVPLHIDDLLKIVRVEDAGVDLSGDLIQVIADALQFCDQRLRIFSHIDLHLLRGSHQEIRDTHAGLKGLFRDGIVLFFC